MCRLKMDILVLIWACTERKENFERLWQIFKRIPYSNNVNPRDDCYLSQCCFNCTRLSSLHSALLALSILKQSHCQRLGEWYTSHSQCMKISFPYSFCHCLGSINYAFCNGSPHCVFQCMIGVMLYNNTTGLLLSVYICVPFSCSCRFILSCHLEENFIQNPLWLDIWIL